MIKRVGGNLTVRKGEAPAESAQLERDGFAVIRGALEPELIADLTDEIGKAFATYGAERGRSDTALLPFFWKRTRGEEADVFTLLGNRSVDPRSSTLNVYPIWWSNESASGDWAWR